MGAFCVCDHALWCTRVGLGFKELKLWYSDYEKTNGTPPSAQQLVQQPQMQHMAQWGAFQALKINFFIRLRRRWQSSGHTVGQVQGT